MMETDVGGLQRIGPVGRPESVIGGVFLEPEVRLGPMIVQDVGREEATQMRVVSQFRDTTRFAVVLSTCCLIVLM
jgi:hypothetical protein